MKQVRSAAQPAESRDGARFGKVRGLVVRALGIFLACVVALSALPAAAQQTPTPVAPAGDSALATLVPGSQSAYTVGQCATVSREQLRTELENAALSVLSSGSNALDIEAIVERQWQALFLDEVMKGQVSSAIDALAAETGYMDRFLSGWSATRAEGFATRVAEKAFSSPSFDIAMSDLALAIGDEVARSVNAELSRAASAAFLCLRDYVGEQYSQTLFDAFEASATQGILAADVEIDPSTLGIGPLDGHIAGVTGASILVVTEIGRRVGAKIGQKLAGRVAGKVVGRVAGRAGSSLLPVVGWIVGVGLIAYDIYEGTQGALPQIEEALTSEEVMQRVRDEVADAVRASLPEEAAIAALETSVEMLDSWDSFCGLFGDVCALAAENDSFKQLLEDAPLRDLENVAALESTFRTALGRSELEKALTTGAFDRLLNLPQAATQILSETRSVEMTLAWVDLAGENLEMVAAIGMHLYSRPEELTAPQIEHLIAMNDGVAVRKFLALDGVTQSALWALPAEMLRDLVDRLAPEEVVDFAAALSSPWVSATPVAEVANAYLAGDLSLEQLRATPAPPEAGATPQPVSQGATPGSAATQPAQTSTSAGAATTEAPSTLAATPDSGSGWQTSLLLGAIVLLLAIIAALLWLRRPSRK